jgi:hypothetical protein
MVIASGILINALVRLPASCYSDPGRDDLVRGYISVPLHGEELRVHPFSVNPAL